MVMGENMCNLMAQYGSQAILVLADGKDPGEDKDFPSEIEPRIGQKR
jgi:hypothetical protein